MEVHQVVRTVKEINKLIKAYETLFYRKPKVYIKGELNSEYTEYPPSGYNRIEKIATDKIYLAGDRNFYWLFDNEYYQVKLRDTEMTEKEMEAGI